MLIINKTGKPIQINELRKIVPGDFNAYNIDDAHMPIIEKYWHSFYVIPSFVVDDIESMKTKIRKDAETLEVERIYIDKYFKLIEYLTNKENDFDIDEWEEPTKTNIDLVYPFQFNGDEEQLKLALYRFRESLKSLIGQEVRICVCNTSKYDIYEYIKEYVKKENYKHLPIKEDIENNTYNRSKTINVAVKQFVKTSYFIVSDIDLIYPETFIEEIAKYTTCPIPCRVIFRNFNLGSGDVFDTFEEYVKAFKNCPDDTRTHGIAGGNGLFHYESFDKIGGYDEKFTEYGPEDQDLNFRLKKMCKYFEIDDPKMNTYHLYHTLTKHDDSKHVEKMKRFLEKKYNVEKAIIDDGGFDLDIHGELLIANNGKWGEV